MRTGVHVATCAATGARWAAGRPLRGGAIHQRLPAAPVGARSAEVRAGRQVGARSAGECPIGRGAPTAPARAHCTGRLPLRPPPAGPLHTRRTSGPIPVPRGTRLRAGPPRPGPPRPGSPRPGSPRPGPPRPFLQSVQAENRMSSSAGFPARGTRRGPDGSSRDAHRDRARARSRNRHVGARSSHSGHTAPRVHFPQDGVARRSARARSRLSARTCCRNLPTARQAVAASCARETRDRSGYSLRSRRSAALTRSSSEASAVVSIAAPRAASRASACE